MKVHISFALLVVFGTSLFNTGMTIAQDESLPRSDPPVKIIKADRASIERIRAEFEQLPTNLEVTYDSKENDQVGGFSVFAPPKYLSITLAGAAAQFVKGKGLRENDLRCEPIFALTPYLDTSREKEAFVVLMALTREFYAHRTPLSSALPFGKGYEPAAWQASNSELIAKLRVACAYCLEYGADTGWRRKYDVADLALERLPATSKAKFDTAGAAPVAQPSAYDAAYAAWEQATHQSRSIEASVDAFSKLYTAWESATQSERDHAAYYYAQAAVTTAARAPKEDAYQLLREAAKVVSEFPIVLSRGKSAKKFQDVASVHARVWSANQTDPFAEAPVGYEMAQQGNGFVALQEAAEIDSAIAADAESAVAGNEGLGLLLFLDKSGSIVQSLPVAITKGSGSIRSRLTAILKHEPAGPSGPSRFVRQEPEVFFCGTAQSRATGDRPHGKLASSFSSAAPKPEKTNRSRFWPSGSGRKTTFINAVAVGGCGGRDGAWSAVAVAQKAEVTQLHSHIE